MLLGKKPKQMDTQNPDKLIFYCNLYRLRDIVLKI